MNKRFVLSSLWVAFAAFAAVADGDIPVARQKLFPETVLVTQTQLYPWREQARGYLGRYANQPLLVDPDLPEDPDRTDIPEFPNWGNFHSQADYDRTLELAKAAGIDGLALFVRVPRFLRACADSRVKGMYTFPIMGLKSQDGIPAFVAYCRRALENPCAYRVGNRVPILSYWTSKKFTPAQYKAACDAARAELGDRFIFFASMPILAREWVRFETNGRQFVPGAREKLKDSVRSYAEVADGIQLSEAHMLAKVEGGERVFAREYWDEIHRLTAEVLAEPPFAGKKYLASAAVNAHMNFYKGGHEVCENGTRSLRDSFEVALKYNPDCIVLPEWDELNENTCFEPTLYGSYAVTRIVRYYAAVAKGRPLAVREGDDTTLPNLIVSYRKSLAPGERLMIEVLNVPDGARSGDLAVRVEIADPEGNVLQTFEPKTLDEAKLAEARFIAGTVPLAPKARALRVRLVWTKDGRDMRIDEGFHLVDLAPANGWNHLCCKQPIRDLVRPAKAEVAFDGKRMKASFACGQPIRYAMLCGNGCIQAVIGKPGSAPHLFREDDDHAVFQITARRLGSDVGNKKSSCTLSVKGVPEVEWLYMKRYEKGETLAIGKHRGSDKSASYYVRLPKASLPGAVLEANFPNAWTGRVDLATAYREGTYATGESGEVMQFTVTRFGLQGQYPSVANKPEIDFDVPVDRDRNSMVYHAQIVMMDGKTWFSRPFVAEAKSGPATMRVWDVVTEKLADVTLPAARVPEFACDFSPRAGNAVLASTLERHWTGMLGGPFTPATLWNRGCLTEGVTVWSDAMKKADPARSGVPARVQEPDGTWSLVFDGEDDYIAFPIETIPADAAFSVEMDIWPEARTDGKPASLLSASRHLANFGLDPSGNFIAQHEDMGFGMSKVSFGSRAEPGRWTHVRLVSTGSELVLTTDGETAPRRIPIRLPAYGSQALSVGGCAYRNNVGFFKGKIRNLKFSQRAAPPRAAVRLEPGRTEVVVAMNAPAIVRFAAETATNFLSQILQSPVPVVTEAHAGQTSVWLGDSPVARAAGVDVAALRRDAFIIRPHGAGVVIAGRDSPSPDPFAVDPIKQSKSDAYQPRTERATLFGVYAFLERYVGVRFYFPSELGTIVPHAASIEIADGGWASAPDFTVRRYGYRDGKIPAELLAAFGGSELVFRRENFLRLRMETEIVPCCHGINKFRYLKRFGKDHPEYFALDGSGNRNTSGSGHIGQICYSSPIAEILYQDVKAYLTGAPASWRGLPAWGQNTVGDVVDIMSQDGMFPCACASCQRRYDFSRKPNFATEFIWSNTVAIARRLTAEGVKGRITQMAYTPYRSVPSVEIPDNVLVMVAEYGPWSLGAPDVFAKQTDEIRAWTEKLGRKVWTWSYPCKAPSVGTALPGLPCVSPRAWGDYYRRIAPYVFGAFAETSSVDRWLYNALGYYVFSRVAWDNAADVDAILDEHYRLMYGPAAPEMKTFFDSLETNWVYRIAGRMHDTSRGPKADPPPDDVIYGEIYSAAVLDGYDGLFKRAFGKVQAGSLECRRLALMKREMLDPIRANLNEYRERKRHLAGFVVRGSADMEPVLLRHLPAKVPLPMTPDLRTAVRMWREGKNLRIVIDCAEPAMAQRKFPDEIVREEDVLNGDSLEIDLNACGDRCKCYSFAINGRNAFADAKFTKRGAGVNVSRDFSWSSGASHRVVERADGWTAELTIPIASLKGWTASHGRLPVNFCRTRAIGGEGGGCDYYVWGPYVKGYHDVQNFGTVAVELRP